MLSGDDGPVSLDTYQESGEWHLVGKYDSRAGARQNNYN